MRTRLKKLIALFGAVTLTASLLLTGCGSSKDKDSASAGGASNSSVVKIGRASCRERVSKSV